MPINPRPGGRKVEITLQMDRLEKVVGWCLLSCLRNFYLSGGLVYAQLLAQFLSEW